MSNMFYIIGVGSWCSPSRDTSGSGRNRSPVINTEDTMGRAERGSRGDGQSAPGPEPRMTGRICRILVERFLALSGRRRTASRSEAIAMRMDCPCSLI
jgi:hypothetical protein